MPLKRPLLLAMQLLLGATGTHAADEVSVQDGEWASYRDAYKQMIRFEKYGKPKHLIQNHFQVLPKDRSVTLDGVRLTLSGRSTELNLPLDAVGRTVFPFLKSAYDDNARLLLNRKANQYALQPRVSIIPRADGSYDVADLRAACEQALDYLRHIGKPSMQDRQCAGVRFSFARNAADPVVRLRDTGQALAPLPVEEGSAFPDESVTTFKTVTYRFNHVGRFAGGAEKDRLMTQGAPVAIAPEFSQAPR